MRRANTHEGRLWLPWLLLLLVSLPYLLGSGFSGGGSTSGGAAPIFTGNTKTDTLQVGPTVTSTAALITARNAGESLEFGHTAAGYASMLGAESGGGIPYMCLGCTAGTTASTYKTAGQIGVLMKGMLTGDLKFYAIPTASADNQAGTLLGSILSTGFASFNGYTAVAGAGQSDAPFQVRNAPNSYEFGHSNTGGYGSTLGFFSGSGTPYLCFQCEAGTNASTLKTRGFMGFVLQSIPSATIPRLSFSIADTASADNQTPTDRVWINGTERLIVVPPSTQTIAATNTIAANACGGIKAVTAAGAVTTNTTNTFTAPAAANTGCVMDVCNTGATNAITLDKNTNFFTLAGADVVLLANTCVRVGNDGTQWRQLTALQTSS